MAPADPGAIAGITIGVLAGVALVAFLLVRYRSRLKQLWAKRRAKRGVPPALGAVEITIDEPKPPPGEASAEEAEGSTAAKNTPSRAAAAKAAARASLKKAARHASVAATAASAATATAVKAVAEKAAQAKATAKKTSEPQACEPRSKLAMTQLGRL